MDYKHSGAPAQFVTFAIDVLDIPDTAAEVIILSPDDAHPGKEFREGKSRPSKLEDMITFGG